MCGKKKQRTVACCQVRLDTVEEAQVLEGMLLGGMRKCPVLAIFLKGDGFGRVEDAFDFAGVSPRPKPLACNAEESTQNKQGFPLHLARGPIFLQE
jgi:hypothetical protein